MLVLADDAANQDADSENADDSEGGSKQGKVSNAWHWLVNNLMVVAIILLLLGGLVALCVYFAGRPGHMP